MSKEDRRLTGLQGTRGKGNKMSYEIKKFTNPNNLTEIPIDSKTAYELEIGQTIEVDGVLNIVTAVHRVENWFKCEVRK